MEKKFEIVEENARVYRCKCGNDTYKLYIIPTDKPPSYLFDSCPKCGQATRYKITEIKAMGEVGFFEKDTFSSPSLKAKVSEGASQ